MQNRRNLKSKILDLLKEQHLSSADEIRKALLKQDLSFNKTSIYRALEKLLSENLVCRHYLRGQEAVFELRQENHFHLLCKKCHQVFSMEKPEQFSLQTFDNSQFKIDHIHVTLIGLCQQCKN